MRVITYISVLLLLFGGNIAHAQDSITQKIAIAICPCFQQLNSKTGLLHVDGADFQQCINKALQAQAADLSKIAMQKYGDSAQAKFQQFAQQTLENAIFSSPLYCDVVVQLADTARYYEMYQGNRDSLKKVMANYNKMDKSAKAIGNYYYHRGYVYMLLGDNKKAMLDADSALTMRPDDERTWQLREWALELNNRFDEALTAVKKLLTFSPTKDDYLILPAVIQRKKQMFGGK